MLGWIRVAPSDTIIYTDTKMLDGVSYLRDGTIINLPFLLVFSAPTQMISNRCVE